MTPLVSQKAIRTAEAVDGRFRLIHDRRTGAAQSELRFAAAALGRSEG